MLGRMDGFVHHLHPIEFEIRQDIYGPTNRFGTPTS